MSNVDQQPPDPRRSLDQSNLLNRRVRKKIAASQERIERGQHQWQKIALGRVCIDCLTSQATGEYEDAVPCRAS